MKPNPRGCSTCEHASKSENKHPCLGCAGRSDHPNWEPKMKIERIGGTPENPQFRCTPAGTMIPGRKDDSGKLDMTLLSDDLPNALEAVCEVLQWAVTKKQPQPYQRGSWQAVEPFQARYRAAMLRHISDASKTAKATGTPFERTRDRETQLLQLAHIATDAMFQLEMAIRDINKDRNAAS